MRDELSRRAFLTMSSGSGAPPLRGPVEQARPRRDTGSTDEDTVRLGFIGVGDRGSWHLSVALGMPGVEVPALCDVNNHYLHRARRWVEAAGQPTPHLYNRSETDFERLIAEEELDAVICSTSWKWHVPVCLAAMRNGKHAVCEVPLVLTVDEAWEVVETYESTGKWATLGLEGFRSLNVAHMAQLGVFGEVRHAEAGYVHDLRLVKFDPEREPWRLQHSVDRNGNLYPDHPMSAIMPALGINRGDRFKTMVSLSSRPAMLNEYAEFYYGADHPHATTPMKQGDYNVSLIRTEHGKMVTLNFDTNTPHPRRGYRLQGTRGVYWSPRYFETADSRIYLDGDSPEEHAWEDAEPYLAKYEHPILKNYNPPPRTHAIQGHGDAATRTPIEWHRLIQALRNGDMPDWDVYDSVTSSVISPLSEQSVAKNGRPVEFPDFTKGKWKTALPDGEVFPGE